jgi:membrane-associated protease RseP (regulator of RpoE activity)
MPASAFPLESYLQPVVTYPAPSPRDWTVAALLFGATLVSTAFAGLFYAGFGGDFLQSILLVLMHPSFLLKGLPFSFTFVTILLAHELGHYFACRYYGIACTPPYFLPFPATFAGTLGAFIRIKSPFPGRRALFDVGIAGPIAGFAFVIPALVVGIANSQLIPRGRVPGLSFGEPLIFRWVGKLVLGYSPATQDMLAHPIAIAAWFGLLATCLNLFPIWQLDGGHVAYAVMGREKQRRLSVFALLALMLSSLAGWPVPSYLLFCLLLLIFGLKYKFHHPPTMLDEEELGSGRRILAFVALVILLVSFTPVPISISGF